MKSPENESGQSKTPSVILFHPGTQHSRELAKELFLRDMLQTYITPVYYRPSSFPYSMLKVIPQRFRAVIDRELLRRRIDGLDEANIVEEPALEWARALFSRSPVDSSVIGLQLFEWHTQLFDRAVAARVARETGNVVWGTPDCPESLTVAKKRGMMVIVEQALGHHAALVKAFKAEGLIADGPGSEFGRSAFHLPRHRKAHAVADLIVVGSEFAAGTLLEEGVPAEKVRVVRYGYEPAQFPAQFPERKDFEGRPVEFLFVGRVGRRKGVPALLEAFARIEPSDARLTIVGPLDFHLPALPPSVRYLGPLSKADVIKQMVAADCFVLPSLFEGSALVLNEAIGSGLPLIQTPSSGAGVVDGQNGLVLPDGSAGSIHRAITKVLADRDLLRQWQRGSWEIRHTCTWAQYGDAVASLLRQTLRSKHCV